MRHLFYFSGLILQMAIAQCKILIQIDNFAKAGK
jgi:hypothetical protein